MKLTDLAISETEIIDVIHPVTDEVLSVEIYKACTLRFNSRLAALGYTDDEELDKKVVQSAMAAFVKIADYDSESNDFLTDNSFSWLALAIFLHINKKKATSAQASSS